MEEKKEPNKKCINCTKRPGKKRKLRFKDYQLNKMDIILCDICYKNIKQDWMTQTTKNKQKKIKI